MPVDSYSNRDYWKAIILYGLNNATYKIALGKTLGWEYRHCYGIYSRTKVTHLQPLYVRCTNLLIISHASLSTHKSPASVPT